MFRIDPRPAAMTSRTEKGGYGRYGDGGKHAFQRAASHSSVGRRRVRAGDQARPLFLSRLLVGLSPAAISVDRPLEPHPRGHPLSRLRLDGAASRRAAQTGCGPCDGALPPGLHRPHHLARNEHDRRGFLAFFAPYVRRYRDPAAVRGDQDMAVRRGASLLFLGPGLDESEARHHGGVALSLADAGHGPQHGGGRRHWNTHVPRLGDRCGRAVPAGSVAARWGEDGVRAHPSGARAGACEAGRRDDPQRVARRDRHRVSPGHTRGAWASSSLEYRAAAFLRLACS